MEIIFASTYELEIRQVVSDVFDSMLDCHAEQAREPAFAGPDQITAAVFFAGLWRGAVLLECGQDETLGFASRLMRIDRTVVNDDDARDAMGEIVNMIGGNLKSVLPHGVGLSLPSVVKGKDYAYRICGNNRRETLAFESCAGSFCVTLVQTVLQP